MVRGEADRTRILREVVEAQRLRVVDQRAEYAAAVRRVADRSLGLRVDAGDDEPLERLPAGVDDPERRIAGSGQLRGRLDDLLEHRVERELGRERDTGVDDCTEAVHLRHGRLIIRVGLGPAEGGWASLSLRLSVRRLPRRAAALRGRLGRAD